MHLIELLIRVLAVVLVPAVALAQTPPPVGTDKPVATVNGKAISASLFQQALQQALAQGRRDSAQLREQIVNQLVAGELFVQAAAKQGLDKDPQVLAIVEEAKRGAMVQRYLRQTLKLNPVTEDQVKARYERLQGAKDYKLRVLLVPNEVRARELRDALGKGKDFGELARQWSLAPSSTRGGELEWVSFKSPAKEGETSGLPLPIAQAVEKLPKSKVSEPINLQGRWWLVRLDDVRPTRLPSYEQARQNIYNSLAAQELQRATAELAQQLSRNATITH